MIHLRKWVIILQRYLVKVPKIDAQSNFSGLLSHRPIVRDNLRYWKVFWDDTEINTFLQNEGNYKDASIDDDYDTDEQEIEVN